MLLLDLFLPALDEGRSSPVAERAEYLPGDGRLPSLANWPNANVRDSWAGMALLKPNARLGRGYNHGPGTA